MSRASDNLRTLEALVEAFNQHDIDRIMEFFADDCSLDMPRGKEPGEPGTSGRVPLCRVANPLRDVAYVHYGDARHFATETMGVSEWLVTGTLRSGETLAVRGCDHYELRDGKVVRKDSYWKIVS